MNEVIARIAQGKLIELIDDQNNLLLAPPMTARDAMFLARGILASAVALQGQNPPSVGQVIGDAHIPVMAWRVARRIGTPFPVMILELPTGIELTFEMIPDGAKDLGAALIAQGTLNQSPGPSSGPVH